MGSIFGGGIGVYIGRGALGSIKNGKTVEKIIQNLKTAKEFNRNWRLHAKLSKPINFLILVIKTVIDPIQWWIILRSVEVHNCRSDWRGTGSQIGKKMKITSDTKSKKLLVLSMKTVNLIPKNGKSADQNKHQNQKTEGFRQKYSINWS